jgi:hypothetical protein
LVAGADTRCQFLAGDHTESEYFDFVDHPIRSDWHVSPVRTGEFPIRMPSIRFGG